MANKISIHVNPHSCDRGYFEDVVRRGGFNTITVFEDFGYAAHLAALFPNTRVAWRAWYPDRVDVDWQHITSETWVGLMFDRWQAVGSPSNLTICTANENATEDPNQISWLCDVIEETERLSGPSLNMLMASVGTPSEKAIDGGLYDGLLGLLARYPRHALVVHEYNAVTIWHDYVHGNTDETRPDDWPKGRVTWWDGKTGGPVRNLPDNFHMGRHEWFNIRAKEIGVNPPTIIIGEFGMDQVMDLEQERRAWGDWSNSYLDGVSTYAAFWEKKTGKPWQEFYQEQIRWYLDNLSPNVLGVELFMWEESGPWFNRGFDIGTRNTWGKFHEWMIAQKEEAVPMAEEWIWLRVGAAQGALNKRANASINAPIVGRFTGLHDIYQSDRTKSVDGYEWGKFSYSPEGADAFYMAIRSTDSKQIFLTFGKAITPPPEPTPEPTPAPQPDPAPDTVTLTITLTTAQMATLRDSVDAWRAVWEQVFPQVKGWEG